MRILFAKFCRERKKKYQIATLISEDNIQLKVIKRPLNKESIFHIEQIFKNYSLLNNTVIGSSVKVAPVAKENSCILFPFIKGKTLNEIAVEQIQDGNTKEFYQLLSDYKNFLYNDFSTIDVADFEEDSKANVIFGATLKRLKNKISFIIPNIDLNFDNLLLWNNDKIIIDYEWVFEFPLPIDYVIFRTLNNFIYNNHMEQFGIYLEDLWDRMELNRSDLKNFKEMENSFSDYIIENKKNQYRKQKINVINQIINLEKPNKYLQDSLETYGEYFRNILFERIDYCVKRGIKVYIWGSGEAAKKTYDIIIESFPLSKLEGFIDNDNKKQGTTFLGKNVFSPIILNESLGNCFVIIGSSYYSEISKQLNDFNLKFNDDYCLGVTH